MNDMSRTGIGGNSPPETMAEEFAIEFAEDLREVDGLVTAAATVPDRIDDDETQNKAAELIKKMRFIELRFEKARDTKREPHRQVIEQINGFFKVWSEKLEKPRKLIKARSDDYLQRKAEEEKRRLRELTGDETLRCEVNNREADPQEQWTWIAANPISLAEYRFLSATIAWSAQYAPAEPMANPHQPVDWAKVPTPSF